jgi:hypothetical protein
MPTIQNGLVPPLGFDGGLADITAGATFDAVTDGGCVCCDALPGSSGGGA